jgi:hypothetical protein
MVMIMMESDGGHGHAHFQEAFMVMLERDGVLIFKEHVESHNAISKH